MTWLSNSKRIGAAIGLLGLGACQMNNPAFDGDEAADEVGDSGDTTAGDSTGGDSGESGSSSESGDTGDTGDTTADDDDDASDSTEEETTTEPDTLPVEECFATFSDPYAPIYGFPEAFNPAACPQVVSNQSLKVTDDGPVAGLLMGQRCAQGCSSCDGESIPLGVVGLSDFATPLVIAANNDTVCLTVQTGNLRGVDDNSRCLYDSIWVGQGDVDLLLAMHRSGGQMPPAGSALLGGKPPPVQGQQLEHCTCAGVYEANDADLACCEEVQGMPFVTSLFFMTNDVPPGGAAEVGLDGGIWTFSVAQAQLLPSCDNALNLALQASWAIVRNGG